LQKKEIMIQIKIFSFNPFQTNTYVLWDESKEAIIIDPSFSTDEEFQYFNNFIKSEGLNLIAAYNTHCHFDHCFGAYYLKKELQMEYTAHQDGVQFTENAAKQASVYGLNIDHIEAPASFIDEGDIIGFGNSELRILNTPGHADGSLCFVSDKDKFVITGDVLFRESIGRTDLPTGNLDVLLESINEKLFKLDGDFIVYPGHGPQSSIAHEQANNPFLHFGEVY
jgi:glyoxylase-like metal-dependent hydrolase (beta-lactamase superfamily II)